MPSAKQSAMGQYFFGKLLTFRNLPRICQLTCVLTPFTGSSLAGLGDFVDGYNFVQRQTRMPVEQSFGMLVARWRVLRAPLAHKLGPKNEGMEEWSFFTSI
jgi:hypothetical protein